MHSFASALLLLFLTMIGLIAPSMGALVDSVSTFVINADTKDTVSAKMINSDGISVGCKFQYDTSASLTNAEPKQFLPVEDLLVLINDKYKCLSRTYGIFEYQVCLGARIAQRADNGEAYSLGEFQKSTPKGIEHFGEGSFCEASKTKRKSIVQFTCAQQAGIVSLDEPAVCSYEITIGVPEVCGHPKFSVKSKQESWLLEISETDDGAVICHAYNNGFDSIGTTTFSSFSLTLTNSEYTLQQYAVRSQNRKNVPAENLKLFSSPPRIESNSGGVQATYVKLVAQ